MKTMEEFRVAAVRVVTALGQLREPRRTRRQSDVADMVKYVEEMHRSHSALVAAAKAALDWMGENPKEDWSTVDAVMGLAAAIRRAEES